jgi:simple sugar transport system ATP-binding protein/ribose transport system ATP-binding protein
VEGIASTIDTPSTATEVAVRSVTKRYGGVSALDDVSVSIRKGSVHALVGENGAGKSTLGKLIAGVHAPDAGQLLRGDRPVQYGAPRDALQDGITLVAQESSLVPGRSVLENVYLGVEQARGGVVSRRRLRARYRELTEEAGFAVDPDKRVAELRVGERKLVEILRALARGAVVIVMDEPTATLSRVEAEQLFRVIRQLAAGGTTIVYVSHFLEEVLSLADTVTVLKDGRLVKTVPAAGETPDTLVTAMLGRSLEQAFPPKASSAGRERVVFSAQGLSREGLFTDVSFDVRAGEIVGIAGLVGAGRSEIAHAIFGAKPPDAGTMTLDGVEISPRSPRAAIKHGIALLPEERRRQGLVMKRSVMENISLAHLSELSQLGRVRTTPELERGQAMIDDLSIKLPSPKAQVSTLSGGNQQKSLFAKWLFSPPKLLIADEPTRGVDVGSKRAIYEIIRSVAESGMGVIMISSEVEEIVGLCHRALVVRRGKLVGEYGGDSLTEDTLIQAAFATGGGSE